MSSFMVNYSRELRMRVDIRREGKIGKVTEFAERIKKIVKSLAKLAKCWEFYDIEQRKSKSSIKEDSGENKATSR